MKTYKETFEQTDIKIYRRFKLLDRSGNWYGYYGSLEEAKHHMYMIQKYGDRLGSKPSFLIVKEEQI